MGSTPPPPDRADDCNNLCSLVPTPSLHGSPLTDAGLALLNPALALHPALVALDLGDCMLGDEAINLICGLLPPDGAKSGEQGPAEGHGLAQLGRKAKCRGQGAWPRAEGSHGVGENVFKSSQEGEGLRAEQDGESGTRFRWAGKAWVSNGPEVLWWGWGGSKPLGTPQKPRAG